MSHRPVGISPLLVVAVLAGCSGSAPEPSPATTRWIAAADAVCARYGPRIAALPAGAPAVRLPALLAVALPEIAEVSLLAVPPGVEGAAIQAVIGAREDALAALTKAAGEALRGADATATLRHAKTLSDHASALATALGMRVCGSAPQRATNST